jgi:hypothetical protein
MKRAKEHRSSMTASGFGLKFRRSTKGGSVAASDRQLHP